MDPLTVVGTVASVCQLAQVAMSLSKSLYTLGTALSSASEDLQVLADDLATFSQSLTLLSRLLEDSKCWYSDGIYLLTAKIIKDCAGLYVQIDRILVKLGKNGKSNWKLRVKFVYKEGQIRKLLSRLRDMKGTLATILMSLQVDLQLSLLNISSSSRIQRDHNQPLQIETINHLNLARQAVDKGGILPKYAPAAESDNLALNYLLSQSKKVDISAQSTSASEETAVPIKTQISVVAQAEMNAFCNFVQVPGKPETQEFASIKTSSSIESFKSALYTQEINCETARKVKAMQKIMYAFKAALQILENLIDRRLAIAGGELHAAAREFERSLVTRSEEIDNKHMESYIALGDIYIQSFEGTFTSRLHEISEMLMLGITMRLKAYSAEHELLAKSNFDNLCSFLDDCSWQTVELLEEIHFAATKECNSKCVFTNRGFASPSENYPPNRKPSGNDDHLELWIHPNSTPDWPLPDVELRFEHVWLNPGYLKEAPEMTIPIINHTFKRFDSFYSDSRHEVTSTQANPPKIKDSSPVVIEAPEMTLPFIGYTFKRFDNFSGGNMHGATSTQVNSPENEKPLPDVLEDPLKTAVPVSDISKVDVSVPEGIIVTSIQHNQPSEELYIGSVQSGLTDQIQAHMTIEERTPPLLTYPSLTNLQTSKIWWQSWDFLSKDYMLGSGSNTVNTLMATLKVVLDLELGLSLTDQLSDEALGRRVALEAEKFTLLEGDEKSVQGIQKIVNMRKKIIRIVQTVNAQIGLDIAALGWSLVMAFLKIHEPVLLTTTSSAVISFATKQYIHLQTIVGIIARYAVMENLYLQSGDSLSLKPEYRENLETLCVQMLRYFADSFILGRQLARQVHNDNDLEVAKERCDKLMQEVGRLDRHCQHFTMLVQAGDWTESDEDEIEDLSDGDWAEISDVELKVESE